MIKSKVRSLFRYVIAFALIFGTVTLNENSKAVDTASPDETFEGKSVRCVIDIDRSKPAGAGYKTGFSYALLSEFSEAVDAKDIAIYTAGKDYDWADSLKSGKVDIVVISESEEIDDEGIILSRRLDNTVWAVNRKDLVKVKELNNWIARFSKSEEYERLWKKYNNTGADPFYALAKGHTVTCLSPYDKLIKEYAGKIDWDWRMLAALIYQESKFSIDTRSHRGATYRTDAGNAGNGQGLRYRRPPQSRGKHQGRHDAHQTVGEHVQECRNDRGRKNQIRPCLVQCR